MESRLPCVTNPAMWETQNDQPHPTDIPPGKEDDFVESYLLDHCDSEADLASALDWLEDGYSDHPGMLVSIMRVRLRFLLAESEGIVALYGAIARWPHIPEMRLLLLRRLVAKKRLAEAQVLLQPIIDEKRVDQIDAVYDLALSFHREGNHRDAIKMLDACEQMSPDIAQNPSFAKLKRIARELRKVRVPFDAKKRFRQDAALHGFLMCMAGLGVLCVLLLTGLGIGSIYLGRHAQVYVVNGIDRDYTVMLNGVPHWIAAHGAGRLDLPEGDVQIAVPALPLIPPTTVPMRQSFFTRPFWPLVFVINPDCAAIIEETVPRYPEYGFAGSERHARYIAGKPLLRFEQIDLCFEPLPLKESPDQQLQLRRRLNLVQHRYDFSVRRDIAPVMAELGRKELTTVLQNQASLSVDKREWEAALEHFRAEDRDGPAQH